MEKSPSTFTVLLKTELTGTQGREIRVGLAEVAPNFTGSPSAALMSCSLTTL